MLNNNFLGNNNDEDIGVRDIVITRYLR